MLIWEIILILCILTALSYFTFSQSSILREEKQEEDVEEGDLVDKETLEFSSYL